MSIKTNSKDPVLLSRQAPTGVPRSSNLEILSSPALPARRAADVLDHLFEGVYDKSPESHISRFLKVLLGDAGAGQTRKMMTHKRLSGKVLTTHFTDLDLFHGKTLGLARMTTETLNGSPYHQVATPEDWVSITARDAVYRSRGEQFVRAVMMGATKAGMEAAAAAVLGGNRCTVYETYMLVDENGGSNPGGAPPAVGARAYGDVEQAFPTYGDIRGTYADVEGGKGSFGRTTTQNRQEFVVRPHRKISLEETYALTKVLSRIKPAEALLTISPLGVEVHTQVVLRAVAADSVYWEVRTQVAPKEEVKAAYGPTAQPGVVQSKPRPAFSGYQGEAWSYNSDVSRVTSYAEDATLLTAISTFDYQRIEHRDGTHTDYTPDRALSDPTTLLLGRSVSDGVLVTGPTLSWTGS